MNIYLPEEIKTTQIDTTTVLVNVFAGTERSVVEMKVDGKGDWFPLKQVKTTDPEILRMHEQSYYLQSSINGKLLEEIFGNAMDSPGITNHMWKSIMPKVTSQGTHTITVRTSDMFGQSWQANRVFRMN
jgi:hypothetical protein